MNLRLPTYDTRLHPRRDAAGAKRCAPIPIVDFKMGDRPVGPKDAMKIAPDRIIEELRAAGYALVSNDRELLPYQFLLVFSRGDS